MATTVTRTLPSSGFILTAFPDNAFSISTSDANQYVDVATAGQTTTPTVPVSVYVGVSGNVKVTPYGTLDASAVTFNNVPAGTMLPVRVTKVWATGTTATGLIGIC